MQDRREPEYLDYNIKGRELYERAPYNAGACYLMGEQWGRWVVMGLPCELWVACLTLSSP